MKVESASAGIAAFFAGWPELGAISGDGVPAPVTDFVRGLLAGRERDDPAGTGLLRPELIVDVVEIVERGHRHVIASFDRFVLRDPVHVAARRYKLTAREREVLTLLLSGMSASAVAERLDLAAATVHHYFKQLRQKTGARTLSGMLATVLGANDAVR